MTDRAVRITFNLWNWSYWPQQGPATQNPKPSTNPNPGNQPGNKPAAK